MIISFGDDATECLYHGKQTKKVLHFPNSILSVALRKLDILNAALRLEDLRVLQGNRLEALKGNLQGYYSIRVNDQWRIIFRWLEGGANDVSLNDYH